MGGVASLPVDPRQRPEVICVGYQRTGTLSMALALEKLGYGPVAHGGSQLVGREDEYMRKLHHVYQVLGNRAELLKAVEAVTIGFGALSDAPYNQFAEELMDLYPDAKFVLLTRDQQAWWESFKPVADAALTGWFRWYFWPMPGWRWWWYIGSGFTRRLSQLKLDGYKPGALHQHKDYVMRTIPADKLLVMDVKDGWEPLCKFLRKPLPAEPFPHANESAAVAKIMPRAMVKGFGLWVGLGSFVGATTWLAWLWLR